MDDKFISKYIHYAEKSLLIFIAFATLFATAQEIIVLIDNKRVLLADLLLLFIYTEVLGMVAAFYRSSRIPVTLPLFIAFDTLSVSLYLERYKFNVDRPTSIASGYLNSTIRLFTEPINNLL